MAALDQLHDSLYREHLEDASWFCEQRGQWLEDPTLELADVQRLEERLEAHLDALVIGGEHAWPRCHSALADGDSTELTAAARVACRMDAPSLLDDLTARLRAPDDRDSVREAAASALSLELHEGWLPRLVSALDDELLGPVVARAAAYQRIDIGDALLRRVLADAEPEAWTIWALGELRHSAARDRLRELAQRGSPSTSRVAALAALKLGDASIAAEQAVRNDPIVRAMVDCNAGAWLCQLAARRVDSDVVRALALCGDRRALGLLEELLGEDDVAPAAAAGLLLTTGLRVLEAEPEPRFGELVGEPEEVPSAPSRIRLCRDSDAWREQLRAHASGPDVQRLGGPHSLAATATAISTLGLPVILRGYLCDELGVRYGTDSGLRPDMTARVQSERLSPLLAGAA